MSDAQRDIETLAALQALYNAIGEEVSTTDPSNLRGRVNEHYRGLYEDTGVTGFEVRVGGEKVGTYGFNRRKGQPERTVREFRMSDQYKCVNAMADDPDFGDFARQWLHAHAEEVALAYFKRTGEIVDGCEIVERTIPAVPDTIRPNGTLRIKRQVVERARAMLAGGGLAGLLGGGE